MSALLKFVHTSVVHKMRRSFSYSAVRRMTKPCFNNRFFIYGHISGPVCHHGNSRMMCMTFSRVQLHTTSRFFNELSCHSTGQREKYDPSLMWNGQVFTTFLRSSGANRPSAKVEMMPVTSQTQSNELQPKNDQNDKKPSLWKRVKTEVIHYYHGFRLLGLEMKIASGICFRLLGGYTLTRRERKQLVRTVADIIRLVPFAVFIIVPFMEFLLPVYIKFFPFMLPSTFKDKSSEAAKIRQRLKAKLEMTRFLQETLHQTSGSAAPDDGTSTTIAEFQTFLQKVQTTGQQATIEDIARFSKLFEDQVTLDSLELKQLKMLCQLLSLPTIGPSNLLRFQIWMRVRQLKAEDCLIAKEGVDELPTWELQTLCQERGMKSAGLTEERLRSQLSQWLTLHLEKNVPVTLLLFSRALSVLKPSAGDLPLKEAIAQLPPSASEEISARVLETTPVTELDPRMKIDVLRKEQASIKAARAQREQELAQQKIDSKSEPKPTPPESKELLIDSAPVISDKCPTESVSDASHKFAQSPKEGLRDATTVPLESSAHDVHVRSISETDGSLPVVKKDSKLDKEEEPEISVEDLTQLESAIAESSDALHEESLSDLKDEVAETVKVRNKHEASLVASERKTDKRTTKVATLLATRVGRLIGEMDTLVDKLADERENLLKDIELREVDIKQLEEASANTEMLDAIKADQERVIDINDLLLSLRRIQRVPDDTRWQKILDVLDEDHDGKIELKHVLSVIKLLGSENVKLSSKEVTRVLEMLDNEESARLVEPPLETATTSVRPPIAPIVVATSKDQQGSISNSSSDSSTKT